MKPFIHPNGNSKESLQKEAREARKAIAAAQDAIADLTIHERNYYPLGQSGIKQFCEDLEERNGMLKKLREIKVKIYEYESHLSDQ